jgi:hypothetical protein
MMTMRAMKTLALAALMSLTMPAFAAGVPAKLYKNPNCGCCEEYAKYLGTKGYDVEVIATHDLAMIKEEHKVPPTLEGCHTTVIGQYVLEGHIPAESIDRLLKERPLIKGLAIPGMPPGTPGMGGEKMGPIKVYYLADTAKPRVYATY